LLEWAGRRQGHDDCFLRPEGALQRTDRRPRASLQSARPGDAEYLSLGSQQLRHGAISSHAAPHLLAGGDPHTHREETASLPAASLGVIKAAPRAGEADMVENP